jgi:hypothetical protein
MSGNLCDVFMFLEYLELYRLLIFMELSVISKETKLHEFPRTVVDLGCAQRNSSK